MMYRVWLMLTFTVMVWGCGKESTGPRQNEVPQADAGADREAWVYTEVTLDGNRSSDPEGNLLRYLWSQDPNNPEEVILAYRPEWGQREEFIAQRTFVPTKSGTYRFMLVVDDGMSSSFPDTVAVTVQGSVRPPRGMVYVPAGEFVMGYNDSKFDADRPEHKVYVDAFFIDKYEVTNREFREFIEVVGGVEYSIPGGSRWGGDNQPVWGIPWDDALRYAEWKGKRLPTDAEWEKAARGTDGRLFPWGNTFDMEIGGTTYHANVLGDEDGYPYTAPVGSFPTGASPYGAMDMVGNVAEWVADWFDEEYYKSSPYKNPTGPASGTHKVHRGGNFTFGLKDLELFKTYHREGVPPAAFNIVRSTRIGFRCAMDAK